MSHNFANARRLLRAREASTLRFATFRVAEEGSQAPVRMAVSAESVAQSDDVSALSHVRWRLPLACLALPLPGFLASLGVIVSSEFAIRNAASIP